MIYLGDFVLVAVWVVVVSVAITLALKPLCRLHYYRFGVPVTAAELNVYRDSAPLTELEDVITLSPDDWWVIDGNQD